MATTFASKTGDKRLRAGLPKDWSVGDKTGTSDSGMASKDRRATRSTLGSLSL
ncbi:hypothetical protein N8E88_30425 [Phyllobacterium zundukense]|uniref:Uncharacterized protein n=1 Tax=Phyllobacterium zundukense TaxID=1867719 RepID=A0ACD4DAL3_9HYPH|nr:hypothetical protein [Phyllobacterium zundukense]UXN62870.1 hypothetical protein N8E88_30425 [Phyllobacterium zundukense]